MRIHILSDLHLEFGPIDLPPTPADLVILAGDIHLKLNGVRWIRHQFPDTPVIYLAGNHEYYGDKLPGLLDKIRAETDEKLQALEVEMAKLRAMIDELSAKKAGRPKKEMVE
jgi:predicted phosphodiesterase